MNMKNISEFYILGIPIETEIGNVDFIRIKDYPNYFADLQVIGMGNLEIAQKYSEVGASSEFVNEVKKSSLFQIFSDLPEIQQTYINVFLKVFKDEKQINLITKDNFDYYRSLIMKMNCVKEEKINPNPEIQRALERSKRVKAREQGKLTFADMCSSIVAHSSIDYHEMHNWTIFQLYMTFHRIGQIKNYDTSTLFATVSSEKIDIPSWSKHINLYEDEVHTIDEDKFKKSTGDILK